MGLDNYFKIKDGKAVSYSGDDLPSLSFDQSIRNGGYFRGKYWVGLFDILLDQEGCLYEFEIDEDQLQSWADSLMQIREKMMTDKGEIFWETLRAKGIENLVAFANEYTYEDAISVCLAVEWYAQIEDICLVGWW